MIDEWRAAEREAAKPPSANQRVENWLVDFMAGHDGIVLADTAKEAAKRAGHNEDRVTAQL